MKLIQIIAAVLLPPLAVFMKRGISGSFWLSILLTLIAFVPGVLYALYVVFTDD